MPKRLLHRIAEDYDVHVDELKEVVFEHLEDSMISVSRGLIWINERGQEILDQTMPARKLHRGIVRGPCPNKNFVWVSDKEMMQRVAVRVPIRIQKRLTGKVIHFLETIKEHEKMYNYVKV